MILKQWSEILRNVTMLSQLGLSFITPLLLCLALCWFIISKTGVGGWIYIPGFFFGMGGSATVAYKFYLSVNKQEKKKHKKKRLFLLLRQPQEIAPPRYRALAQIYYNVTLLGLF